LIEDQFFLDAIAAEPENLTTRLVYCDWLEERNDLRHLYLRAWCHLNTFPSEEFIGYPDLRIELARLAESLPTMWLESMNCRKFYLDQPAAYQMAVRHIDENFPRSKQCWIEPWEAEESAAGWYYVYRSRIAPESQQSPTASRILFVHRARAYVQRVGISRYFFDQDLASRHETGPPI
jgi:uncharacterized protein (TIGR02996 family)